MNYSEARAYIQYPTNGWIMGSRGDRRIVTNKGWAFINTYVFRDKIICAARVGSAGDDPRSDGQGMEFEDWSQAIAWCEAAVK